MFQRILSIVFFALIGIYLIWHVPYLDFVAGITAILLAVAIGVEK